MVKANCSNSEELEMFAVQIFLILVFLLRKERLKIRNVLHGWFNQAYVSGRRVWHQLNHIFVYFSHWKLQDLVENFESAAGFPRIVVVFTSELKQAACSGVQTVRK